MKNKNIFIGFVIGVIVVGLAWLVVEIVTQAKPVVEEAQEVEMQEDEETSADAKKDQQEPETQTQDSPSFEITPYRGNSADGYVFTEFVIESLGEKGTVFAVCPPDKLVKPAFHHHTVCLGKNSVILSIGAINEVLIAEYTTLLPDETLVLNDVQVVEQKDRALLLVSLDPNRCAFVDGLCLDPNHITHIVDLSNYDVREVSFDDLSFFNFDQLIWNPSGTKAIKWSACAEGCPKDKYWLVNLEDETAELLLDEDDFEDLVVPKAEDIEWVDEDTVRILGEEYEIHMLNES